MSDTSAYDDPVVDILTSSQPTDKDAAKGFLARHNERASTSESKFNDIMKQRAEAMEMAKARLDETIGQMRAKHEGSGFGQVNLPLMSFAAGLLAPAPPGVASNFGQELSRGLSSMGTTIRSQRMQDSDFLKGIAELQAKGDAMSDKPRADAQTAEMRKQIAAETASAGIEKSLIRSGGVAGATPAKVKEFQEWQKTNPDKSYEDFLLWYAKNVKNDKKPAVLQEFDVWQAANPDKSLAEFYTDRSRAQAGGRETGKTQAEIAMTLPGIDANIDQMVANVEKLKKHPGLPKAVGLVSMLPSIPGGDAADFESVLDQLKGQAFLVQFDKLRGAGAITEAEGKKATDALAALSTKQGQTQFKEQLDLVKSVLEKGREVARQKAAVSKPADAPDKPPMAGARKAPGGKWYLEKDGKFFEVRP